jgi:chemotaxis protein MotA
MDFATLIGVILAFVCLALGITLEGGDLTKYIAPSAFIIVIPSTFGASMAAGYLKDLPLIFKGAKAAFMTKQHDGGESIELMVKFAEKARREGLLALEEAVKDVDDPFMKKGVEMAVDGTDPEQLREILEAEIDAKRTADKVPAKFFADMGGFSPTLGIIGTVLGLVVVLQHLSDPASLGPHIAAAFIATLYGVATANLVYLPVGKKIARTSEIECHHMEVVVEGVLSIQAGANPRVIHQKLTAFMGHTNAKPAEESKGKAA